MVVEGDRITNTEPIVPSLVAIVERTQTIACWAGGLIATTLLLAGHLLDGGAAVPWQVTLGVAALWLLGLLLRGWRRACTVIVAILLAPLMSVVVPGFAAPESTFVPQVVFAAVVTAGLPLPLPATVIVVLIGALIEGASGSGNPLFFVVVGIGFAVTVQAWHRFAVAQDAMLATLQRDWQQTRMEQQLKEGRFFVSRRLHETILNTLSGIAAGVKPEREQVARATARADLLQLDLGSEQLGDSRCSSVIAAAQQFVLSEGLDIDLAINSDPMLDAATATVLRDAVVEALRNVARHSGVRRVGIGAYDDGGWLVVRILDHGAGIGAGISARFGVRHTIEAGMAMIGGSGVVEPAAHQGTEVTLRIPPHNYGELPRVNVQPLGVFDDSAAARWGLISGVLFMLINGWSLYPRFSHPSLVMTASLACLAGSVALCVMWNSRWRVALAITVPASTVAAYCVIALSVEGQASLTAVLGLHMVLSGGALLPMFAFSGLGQRISVVTVMLVSVGVLVMAMPADSRAPFVAPIALNVAYVTLVLVVASWLINGFAPRKERLLKDWLEQTSREAERLGRLHIQDEWIRQGGSARALLEGISTGALDLQDPEVLVKTESEARALRARMSMPDLAISDSGLDAALRDLVLICETVNANLDVAALSESTRPDRLPTRLLNVVFSVVQASGGDAVLARALIDSDQEELVVVVPLRCAQAAGVVDGLDLCDDAILALVTDRQPERSDHVRFTMSIRRPSKRRPS